MQNDRDSSPERVQNRSRVGDAFLIGIASSAAAIEEGVFHWKVAIAVLLVATALWLLVSRALGQYSATNGRGFLGDIALTLVMVTAVVVPIALVLLVFPRSGATLHPGRSLIALVPTVILLRIGIVGVRLWRASLAGGPGRRHRPARATHGRGDGRRRGAPAAERIPALRGRGATRSPGRAALRHRPRPGGFPPNAPGRRGLLRVDRQRARRGGPGGDPHVRDAGGALLASHLRVPPHASPRRSRRPQARRLRALPERATRAHAVVPEAILRHRRLGRCARAPVPLAGRRRRPRRR